MDAGAFPTLCWPGKTQRRCDEVLTLLLRETHPPPGPEVHADHPVHGERPDHADHPVHADQPAQGGHPAHGDHEEPGDTQLTGTARESGRDEARPEAPPPSYGAWPNLLVRADNRLLLSTLLNGPLRQRIDAAGGIRLVYLDPPFAVGSDFTLPGRARGVKVLAYSDTWPGGLNGYLDMMYERLLLLRDLLAPDGSLFLHCDRRTAPYLRLLLDEIFGVRRFLGDIVWHYTGGGRARRWFSRKHDRILHYAVSDRWTFNPDAVRVPYKPTSGYARGGIVSRYGRRYLPDPRGTPVDDVWDIPMLNPLSPERNGYPTQKPERLLERIILAASRPGDLVADFFCGSGTMAAVAARLGRRWLAADASGPAVAATRNRLAGQPGPGFILADLVPAELPNHGKEPENEPGREHPAQDPADSVQPVNRSQRDRHARPEPYAPSACHIAAHAGKSPTERRLPDSVLFRARLSGSRDAAYRIHDIRMETDRSGEGLCIRLLGFAIDEVREDRPAAPPGEAALAAGTGPTAPTGPSGALRPASPRPAPASAGPVCQDTAFSRLTASGWRACLDSWSVGLACAAALDAPGCHGAHDHFRVLWTSGRLDKADSGPNGSGQDCLGPDDSGPDNSCLVTPDLVLPDPEGYIEAIPRLVAALTDIFGNVCRVAVPMGHQVEIPADPVPPEPSTHPEAIPSTKDRS